MNSRVVFLHEPDVECGIHRALDQLGELESLFRGRHVAVKPNETWASNDDLTACTQADSVRAVIRYVKRFEPKAITVTGGAGAGETDEIFRFLGIDRVIEEERVAFRDHNRPPFQAVQLQHGPHREITRHPQCFFDDMHGHIAGMCQRFPIDLAIIVGPPAMIEKGPIGGRTFESELIIAGRDFGVANLDDMEIAPLSLNEARELFERKAAAASSR